MTIDVLSLYVCCVDEDDRTIFKQYTFLMKKQGQLELSWLYQRVEFSFVWRIIIVPIDRVLKRKLIYEVDFFS